MKNSPFTALLISLPVYLGNLSHRQSFAIILYNKHCRRFAVFYQVPMQTARCLDVKYSFKLPCICIGNKNQIGVTYIIVHIVPLLRLSVATSRMRNVIM